VLKSGAVIFGAGTRSSSPCWKYVNTIQFGPTGKGILTPLQLLFCFEPEDGDRTRPLKAAFLSLDGAMDKSHTIMIPNVVCHQNSMKGYVLCTVFGSIKINT